jgi:hypothetical protein
VGIGRPEQAGVLALVSAATGDWSKVAGLLVRTGGVGPVMSGQVDRIPLDDRALAAEQGRRLFLLDRLAEEQDWAKRYAEKPGVQVVRDPADVLPALSRLADPTYQMTLTF